MDSNTAMGPLTIGGGIEKLERPIQDATNKGGKILCGGKRTDNLSVEYENGYLFEPNIVASRYVGNQGGDVWITLELI